jgi:hypothetical protein
MTLADMRRQRDDMEQQRDKWETVAQRLALPAPKPVEEPMTWWRDPPSLDETRAMAGLDRCRHHSDFGSGGDRLPTADFSGPGVNRIAERFANDARADRGCAGRREPATVTRT